jgi:hypothetical protein
MRTIPFALCLMPVLLAAGCAQPERSRAGSSASTQPAANDCVVTQPIRAQAPENTEGGPPGPESWYMWYTNADRSIWMLAQQDWVPKERFKVGWFRPARTKLQVSGRRLDAPAPPLFVETSPSGEEYRHKFQPSIMIFPTAGCWEIVAKAAQSEARFVIKVPGGNVKRGE